MHAPEPAARASAEDRPGVHSDDRPDGGRSARHQDHDAWNRDARDETPMQRLDRNYAELLQELRVAQIGVQILFAFLLTIGFQGRFPELTADQRTLYAATLVACAAAMVLLVAPVALHRLTFRRRLKPVLVAVSHRAMLAGLTAMALAVVGSVGLVVWFTVGSTTAAALAGAVGGLIVACWLVVPLLLRARREPD